MNKQEFANKVAELVGGKVQEVEKANGVKFVAITTDSGCVRPNVYIDENFEKGMSVEETAENVRKVFSQNIPEIDTRVVMNYDKMREYLTARLYHNSTHAEVAKSASEYGFDDLIIVPYISGIKIDTGATGAIKVTKELTERWGVSEDTIFADAFENVKKNMTVKDMSVVMSELSGIKVESGFVPENEPLIVSNSEKNNGAISVMFCKEKLQERFPNGYTVIPSSIHECMIMPYMGNVDFMVQEVNKQELKPQDVLSDHAYYFADVA